MWLGVYTWGEKKEIKLNCLHILGAFPWYHWNGCLTSIQSHEKKISAAFFSSDEDKQPCIDQHTLNSGVRRVWRRVNVVVTISPMTDVRDVASSKVKECWPDRQKPGHSPLWGSLCSACQPKPGITTNNIPDTLFKPPFFLLPPSSSVFPLNTVFGNKSSLNSTLICFCEARIWWHLWLHVGHVVLQIQNKITQSWLFQCCGDASPSHHPGIFPPVKTPGG